MASIWMQTPGSAPTKLQGMLPASAALGLFKIRVAKVARANHADVVYQDDMEAVLQLPPPPDNGGLTDMVVAASPYFVVLWVEPYSPPSAPETGQPKVLAGQDKGILITAKGAFDLALPVKS